MAGRYSRQAFDKKQEVYQMSEMNNEYTNGNDQGYEMNENNSGYENEISGNSNGYESEISGNSNGYENEIQENAESAANETGAYNSTGNSYSYGYGGTAGSGFSGEDSASGSSFQASGEGNGTNQTSGSGFHGFQKAGHKKPAGDGKKGGKFVKKAAAIALSAVLFGGIAGSAMVGVQYAAQKAGVVSTASSETTQSQVKLAESTSTSSKSSSSSSSDVSSVVEKVLPSVVAITNSQIYENYSNQGWPYSFWNGNSGKGSSSSGSSQEVETGSGSGIIIGQNDSELLIVTNYHVIENADSLTITFADDKTAKASVKGTDSDNDLAVVSVSLSDLSDDTKKAIAIATMDTSDDCKVGQQVVAIGNALGYGQSSTVGYISALNRKVATSDSTSQTLLQTDAAINPGNSGGALVNMDGEIIGINSAKYSDTSVEGMGFAIPISKVHDIIDNLMNQKTKVQVAENQRGYLGIQATTVDSSTSSYYSMPEGVYVYKIMDGGAASKSDLQERDIITKLDDTAVTTKEALTEALKYYSVGDKVKLSVSRLEGNEYKTVEVTVTLAKQVQQQTQQ